MLAIMAKRGKHGGNNRFKEQLLNWVTIQNIDIVMLVKEGYELEESIGGGNGDSKWPIEVFRCGVCELPKPTGVKTL